MGKYYKNRIDIESTWDRLVRAEASRETNKSIAEYRKEVWLRENIDSEIDFARKQRKMWQEKLEKAEAAGDVAVVLKTKRDLEHNEKRLTDLIAKKKEFVVRPLPTLVNAGNEGR